MQLLKSCHFFLIWLADGQRTGKGPEIKGYLALVLDKNVLILPVIFLVSTQAWTKSYHVGAVTAGLNPEPLSFWATSFLLEEVVRSDC